MPAKSYIRGFIVGLLGSLAVSHMHAQLHVRAGMMEDPSFTETIREAPYLTYDFETDISKGKGIINSSFWLKVIPENILPSSKGYYLVINNHILDSIQVYARDTAAYLHVGDAGALVKHSDWAIDASYPSFFLSSTQIQQPIYVRVRTSVISNIPLKLLDAESYKRSQASAFLFMGIFNGILFLFMLGIAVLYWQSRNTIYLYFLGYLLLSAFFAAVFKGYGFRFFWPESTAFNYFAPELSSGLIMINLAIFAVPILHVKKVLPKLILPYRIIIGLMICLVCISAFLPKTLSVSLFNTVPHAVLIFVMVTSFISWQRGNRAAKFFFFGWLCMVMGGFLFLAKDFGFLPHNFLTVNAVIIAFFCEIILLYVSVGLRIKDNLTEHKSSLKQLQQKQKEVEELRSRMEKIQQSKKEEDNVFDLETINAFLEEPISKRESEVLLLLIDGNTNKVISEKLFVSENTIKKHISAIYRKLDVHNRAQVSARTFALSSGEYPKRKP